MDDHSSDSAYVFGFEFDLPQLLRHIIVQVALLSFVLFLYSFEIRIGHPAAQLSYYGFDL
ncbi:hypothetical protein D3C73_1603730 [compost metagenome]